MHSPAHIQKASDSGFSRVRKRPVIQAELEVGKPGDKYEQEADAVAQRVMMQPSMNEEESLQMQTMNQEEELLQRKPVETVHEVVQMQADEEQNMLQMQAVDEEEEMLQMSPSVQMKCEYCELEEKISRKPEIHRSGDGIQTASPDLANRIHSAKGGGRPLESGIQREMESKIGADFSSVNIHTGPASVQMNRELGAKAFTVGNDIHFNRGQYDPHFSKGKRLLAHELTHVVQQSNAGEVADSLMRNDRLRQSSTPHLHTQVVQKVANSNQGLSLFLNRQNEHDEDETTAKRSDHQNWTHFGHADIQHDQFWQGLRAIILKRVRRWHEDEILGAMTYFIRHLLAADDSSATTDLALQLVGMIPKVGPWIKTGLMVGNAIAEERRELSEGDIIEIQEDMRKHLTRSIDQEDWSNPDAFPLLRMYEWFRDRAETSVTFPEPVAQIGRQAALIRLQYEYNQLPTYYDLLQLWLRKWIQAQTSGFLSSSSAGSIEASVEYNADESERYRFLMGYREFIITKPPTLASVEAESGIIKVLQRIYGDDHALELLPLEFRVWTTVKVPNRSYLSRFWLELEEMSGEWESRSRTVDLWLDTIPDLGSLEMSLMFYSDWRKFNASLTVADLVNE